MRANRLSLDFQPIFPSDIGENALLSMVHGLRLLFIQERFRTHQSDVSQGLVEEATATPSAWIFSTSRSAIEQLFLKQGCGFIQ